MAILAISNIHGRYDEMYSILKRIEQDYGDLSKFERIVFLGDYIGFGNKNVEVIRYLLELKKKLSNLVLLQGDWEDALFTIEVGKDEKEKEKAILLFEENDQNAVLEQLRKESFLLETWIEAINEMPIYHVEEETKLIFSHCGVNFSAWEEDMDIFDFLEECHSYSDFLWREDFFPSFLKTLTRIIDGEEPSLGFDYSVVMSQNYLYPAFVSKIFGINFRSDSNHGSLGAVVFEEEQQKIYKEKIGTVTYVPSTTSLGSAKSTSRKTGKITLDTTWEMVEKGMSAKEIASIRGLAESTIEGHLVDLYLLGFDVDIEQFIFPVNEPLILSEMKIKGVRSVKRLKDILPRGIRYSEIKAVAAKHGIKLAS